MSKAIDLAERLSSVTKVTSASLREKSRIIDRRYSARSMLNSGSRLLETNQSLKETFSEATNAMAKFAVQVVAPSSARLMVDKEARSLQSAVLTELDEICAGKTCGIMVDAKSHNELRQSLEQFCNRVITDTRNEISTGIITGPNGPVGAAAFLKKNLLSILLAPLKLFGKP